MGIPEVRSLLTAHDPGIHSAQYRALKCLVGNFEVKRIPNSDRSFQWAIGPFLANVLHRAVRYRRHVRNDVGTHVGDDVRAKGEAEPKERAVWKCPLRPVHHLSNIPGRPRIEEYSARDLAICAPPGVDDTDLPLPTVQYQRGDGMTEVNFMRTP
jgi:hypothetical protein